MSFQQSTREHVGPQGKDRQYARPPSQQDAWPPVPRLGRDNAYSRRSQEPPGGDPGIPSTVKCEIPRVVLADPPCCLIQGAGPQVKTFLSMIYARLGGLTPAHTGSHQGSHYLMSLSLHSGKPCQYGRQASTPGQYDQLLLTACLSS